MTNNILAIHTWIDKPHLYKSNGIDRLKGSKYQDNWTLRTDLNYIVALSEESFLPYSTAIYSSGITIKDCYEKGILNCEIMRLNAREYFESVIDHLGDNIISKEELESGDYFDPRFGSSLSL